MSLNQSPRAPLRESAPARALHPCGANTITVSSGVAALLGVRALTIVVRDNIDEFIGDLQKHGRWASYAAVAAAIATALQALSTLRGRRLHSRQRRG